MSPLDLKKKKVELMKVTAARHELEIRVDEITLDIDRLKNLIETQKAKEAELTALIEENTK